MFDRYKFSYDFAAAGRSNAPGNAEQDIRYNIVMQAGELEKKGYYQQVAGGLTMDFNERSFSIKCTAEFAQALGRRPGISPPHKI
jgi:hypothetical protein